MILTEQWLLREQGMAILEDMTSISEEEPLPIIRAYIDLNLLTLHQVLFRAQSRPPCVHLDCHCSCALLPLLESSAAGQQWAGCRPASAPLATLGVVVHAGRSDIGTIAAAHRTPRAKHLE
jgi:hypothetical protein